MAKRTIGELPPRYSFLLNPYSDVRLSRCPNCERLTHLRKFALLIDIAGWGTLVLGKTCRYCTPCELIMAHQDELEGELAVNLNRMAPEAVGSKYLALGTMDKRVWKAGLGSGGTDLRESLAHVAMFRRHMDLKVDPGGWRPAE